MFTNSLSFKRLGYLFSYIGVNSFVYIIFISAIAFFHFLIDHTMMDIEAWVFDKSWTIFLLIKTISIYCLYHFLAVKLPAGTSFFSILKTNNKVKNNEIVGVITLLFLTLMMVKPELQGQKNIVFTKVAVAFLSSFFLFSLDSVLIYLIERILPHTKKEKIFYLLIYSTLLGGLNFFQFGSNIDYLPFIFIIHFLNIYFILINKNLRTLLFFNLVLTAPLVSFIGVDPVWGTDFSILEPQIRLTWINILVLLITVLGYWKWKGLKKNGTDQFIH